MRVPAILLAACLTVACGNDDASSTSPTPVNPPTPPTVALAGTVSASNGSRLAGASLSIVDGMNAGRATTTNASGDFRFEGLRESNGNVRARATGYTEQILGTFINGTNTLAFSLAPVPPPAPLWTASGAGNDVLDKPRTVTRVRITGRYTANSSNFIVWCNTQLVVNELLGTAWGRTTYEGTHATPSCTQVRIENSTGVAWTFTEVR